MTPEELTDRIVSVTIKISAGNVTMVTLRKTALFVCNMTEGT